MIVDMRMGGIRASYAVASFGILMLAVSILLVVVGNRPAAAAAHYELIEFSSASPASPSPGTSTSSTEQEQKLKLEIQQLEEATSTAARIRSWLPIGSIIVALGAGIFGAYQYFHDRHRDNDIRVQEQFSTHLATVAGFIEENIPSSARLLTALTGLEGVVPLMRDPGSHRKQVTDVIHTAALQDVDFENPLQARFEPLCFDKWPDYRNWLSENPPQHRFLLYRYLQAVRVLCERYPDYFRNMTLLEDGTLSVSKVIEERDFIYFQQLARGYAKHIWLQRTQDRPQSITEFGDAIKNPSVARQLFNVQNP
jgi:hypothetical protein